MKIYSQKDLIKKNCRNSKGDLYIVYELAGDVSEDFDDILFDLRKLSGFKSHRSSAKPFSVTLSEALKSKTVTDRRTGLDFYLQ